MRPTYPVLISQAGNSVTSATGSLWEPWDYLGVPWGALYALAGTDMPGRTASFGSHNLLSGLPTEYFTRLLANAPTIGLTKGQALFQNGAPADGCYWLTEGVLKVSITSDQ